MTKFYISILALICAAVISLGNSGGRGNIGGEAVTGAPGEDGRTCATCHNENNFDISFSFDLFDDDGSSPESIIAGEKYFARIEINTTGTPDGFGFQMVALDQNNEQAGTWVEDEIPEGIGTVNLLDRSYIEHRNKLSFNAIELAWIAPDDAEEINFFVACNSVNGDNAPSGDGAASDMFSFPAILASNKELNVLPAKVYPNPVNDVLHIENITSGEYQIHGTDGQLVKRGNITNEINIAELPSGLYILSAQSENALYSSRFIKR